MVLLESSTEVKRQFCIPECLEPTAFTQQLYFMTKTIEKELIERFQQYILMSSFYPTNISNAIGAEIDAKVVTVSARIPQIYTKFANFVIFRILPHFTTKLRNITHFKMLLSAVAMD